MVKDGPGPLLTSIPENYIWPLHSRCGAVLDSLTASLARKPSSFFCIQFPQGPFSFWHPEVSWHAIYVFFVQELPDLLVSLSHKIFFSPPYTTATQISSRKEGKKKRRDGEREGGPSSNAVNIGRCWDGSVLGITLPFHPCSVLRNGCLTGLDSLFPSFCFFFADSLPQQVVLWICRTSLWTSRPASWRWRAVRLSSVAPSSLSVDVTIRKPKTGLIVRGMAYLPYSLPLPFSSTR